MHAAFPDRQLPPDASMWHLCWQAAVGRDFLANAGLPLKIRNRLIEAHLRPGRLLLAYLLLPSEIHVVCVIPEGDSPGGLARSIGNVISRWVRVAQPVRSPVLAGPHRSVRIDSVAELREEIRMLAWRPVQLQLCRTPTHHVHGSVRVALGRTPARGFDAWPLLSVFGYPVPEARAALRQWLSRRPSDENRRRWELMCGLVLATGSVGAQPGMARELRTSAAAALVAAAGHGGIVGALDILATWVAAGLDARGTLDLKTGGGKAAARGRALVACLAVHHGLCSAASVARHFGKAKATLSEQMAACRRRPADRLILSVPVRRIVEETAALRAAKPHTV